MENDESMLGRGSNASFKGKLMFFALRDIRSRINTRYINIELSILGKEGLD